MSKPVVVRRPGIEPAPLLQEVSQIATAIGVAPTVVAPMVAAEIARFAVEGTKALDQAERLDVESGESAGIAADLIKSINAELKVQDAARKKHTAPLDDFKEKLIKLYGVGLKSLQDAKSILTSKLQHFQSVERARQQQEADRVRILQQQEAERLAAAQAAIGDTEGAKQIIEDAAALPVEAPKPQVAGTYSVAGLRKVAVGTVRDRIAFLEALVAHSLETGYAEVLNSIEFGQRELNALSRLVIDKKTPAPAGFSADEKETTNVR